MAQIAKFLRRPHLYYLLSLLWVLFIGLHGERWPALSADWMLLSGFAALLIGLTLTRAGRSRVEQMLDRLDRRGVLGHAGTDIQKLKRGLEERAGKFAAVTAVVVALSIAAAFLPQIKYMWLLCLFETAWAFVAGRRLGRMIAYGSMGWYLRAQRVELRPIPGHIDGAAGLRPVGNFCLFQATVLAIPALYLAIWSFAIQAFPAMGRRYSLWMHPFLWLLALAIVAEVLVFVVPMWRFHLDMAEAKEHLLPEADRLSEAIAATGARLGESKTREEHDALDQELASRTKQYWEIESMPTWPLDVGIVRQFVIRNTPLVIPLIAEVTGVHDAWVKLLEKAVGPAQ